MMRPRARDAPAPDTVAKPEKNGPLFAISGLIMYTHRPTQNQQAIKIG